MSRKCYLYNYIVAYQILSFPVLVKTPSELTLAYLLNMFTSGTRVFVNLIYLERLHKEINYPLSLELNPNLAPMSPNSIDGRTL
jgi:hypothetical protein